MRALLDGRGDLLLVTGLGSTTYDAAAVADDERNFYLWGAMGAASMVGLGLALAQPKRRVLVVTGDGEMLMGLGALATIGVTRPAEPRDCRVRQCPLRRDRHAAEPYRVRGQPDRRRALLRHRCGIRHRRRDRAAGIGRALRRFERTIFARVAIRADEPLRVLPSRDGVFLKNRMRGTPREALNAGNGLKRSIWGKNRSRISGL